VIIRQATGLANVAGSGTYGNAATLTATLTAGGAALDGEAIDFTLNNGTTVVDVGSATTDSQGVAVLQAISLHGFNAGTYPGYVGARFVGDANHAGSSATGDLTVQKATATVTLDISSLNQVYDGQP